MGIGPCQRAGEAGLRGQTEAATDLCRQLQLRDSSFLTRFRIFADMRGCKPVALGVIGRVHRHQLALKMRRQFRDDQPLCG